MVFFIGNPKQILHLEVEEDIIDDMNDEDVNVLLSLLNEGCIMASNAAELQEIQAMEEDLQDCKLYNPSISGAATGNQRKRF